MEDILISLSPMVSNLEPLRPLSPEVLDHKELENLDVNVAKLSRSEFAGKLLDHLDELHTEEAEPFDWFATEKSINFPLFDNLLPPASYRVENHVKPISNYQLNTDNVKNDSSLIQNCVSDAIQSPVTYQPYYPGFLQHSQGDSVHSTNSEEKWLKDETLTPPDSPKDEEILKLLQEIEPEELEQLVMARTEYENSAVSFSENISSLDEFSDVGSSSPFFSSDSSLDDPEWSPPSSVKCISGKITNKKRNFSKPYSKPAPEDKKLRKKEQNKNAATRYRMKKKAEVQEIKSEEKILEEKNKELQDQFDDLSREVRYLKSLMRDVYRKKGLIN